MMLQLHEEAFCNDATSQLQHVGHFVKYQQQKLHISNVQARDVYLCIHVFSIHFDMLFNHSNNHGPTAKGPVICIVF